MNHRPRHTLIRPWAVALGLCSLLAALPAGAGNVVARAGQNPDSVVDNNDGALATASWPALDDGGTAQATTTRTDVAFQTLGHGASSVFHMNAGANHRTNYRLWDLDTNQPLPAIVANTLTLDFHFRLQGQLEVEPISLSNASVQWSAAVIAGAAASQANSSAIIVFGPAPGNLDGEYLYTGDASLWGSFDQRFSLQHDSASSGVLTMASNGSSGNRALSHAHLSLVGLSYTIAPAAMGAASLLADGSTFSHNVSSLNGGLGHIGIRFVETGQILAVSAVPEPQTWALGLSGLMLLVWHRRRALLRA